MFKRFINSNIKNIGTKAIKSSIFIFFSFSSIFLINNSLNGKFKKYSLEDISNIRRETYSQVKVTSDLENSKHLILNHNSLTPEELSRRLKMDIGGVWCAGAATHLRNIYLKKGLKSWLYNFGFQEKDLLSHVVTLVEINGKIYVQDAYFNITYEDNFRELLRKIANKEIPKFKQDYDSRNLLISLKDFNALNRNFVNSSLPKGKECIQISDNTIKCEVIYTKDLFKTHINYLDTSRQLLNLGYPSSIDSLMMLPINIHPHDPMLLKEVNAIINSKN